MKKITLPSHAKINLALDVLGMENSYHLIQTVYQKIDLADEVEIQLNNSGKIISKEKLAKKAAKLFFKKIKTKISKNKKFGLMIKIRKNIPYRSGLGGASGNAAAVLKGLNRLFKNPLTKKELMTLAEKLGMDVPFFASSYTTALGTHYGEKIKKLPTCPRFKYQLIFLNNKKSSTKDIYQRLDLLKCGKNKHKTQKLIEGLKKGKKQIILKNLHNDFEQLWEKPHHLSPLPRISRAEGQSSAHQQPDIKNTKFLLAGAGPTWIIFSIPTRSG